MTITDIILFLLVISGVCWINRFEIERWIMNVKDRFFH
jgi:hypothetical protein